MGSCSNRAKEEGEAVGYLPEGAMVAVMGGRLLMGQKGNVEIASVIPSVGGKMNFGRLPASADSMS